MPPVVIKRGKGLRLYDRRGHWTYDVISGAGSSKGGFNS